MSNILVYLASNYADFNQRAKVEELDLASKNLTGELDFTNLGFTGLKKLIVANNQLTKIVLTNPQQITYLDVSNNQLTYLNISQLSSALAFGEIKNNPLPLETKKNWLVKRWNYYKDLEMDWPELLVPQISKLVDISDLNNFVLNYDFNQEGNAEYHQIIGNGFTSLLDERALELLSQQVLARCLIKQNQLVDGKNEEYEQEISNLARQFQRASNMFLKAPLKTIQKEVIRELAGKKDLVREFQNQLEELEMILRTGDEPLVGVPDLEQIKNKIGTLQNTIQKQKKEIIQLQQTCQEKKQSYNQLWKTNEEKEEKLKFYSDNVKTKEGIINDYKQEVNQLEEKIQDLVIVEENEKNCRQRIADLEQEINDKTSALQNEFNQLLLQKDNYISQLEETLKELKESKQALESNLKSSNALSQKLLSQEQSRQNKWAKIKKWGIIGIILLVVIGLGCWGYQKLKKVF
jgi:hypothetical protein